MTGSLVIVAGKDPLSDDPGHSSYVRAHARAAVRAGYRPHLLCVGDSGQITETELGTVIRIRSLARPVRALMMPIHGPALARGFAALARRLPEPVIGHGFAVWTIGAVEGAAAARRAGRRSRAVMGVYTTHPAESRSQLAGVAGQPGARLSYAAQAVWSNAVISRYERRALHGAAAVYANYECVRRLIGSRYGEIEVLDAPYASELAFEARWEGPAPAQTERLTPSDAPLVLAMSSHDGRKGVDVLIDALAWARDQGTALRGCLLGNGRLLEAHRRRIAAQGLERSVVAPGWIADNRPLLAHADIFALPSRAEQSGSMAVLEALQYSLPTVASAVDGIPEDLIDGESGLLVSPGDHVALGRALVALATDRALRDRVARGGRAAFEQRFSGDRLAGALDEIYRGQGLSPG